MGHAGFKPVLALVALFLATGAFADDEQRIEHDRAKLSIFGQASISFLDFEERSYFQNAIDTIYADFRSQAVNAEESLYVAKQNFQKVNFCFPIMGGIQYQLMDDHFLSAGIGFIYDNESVVLTDRKNKAHNYNYTIQGVPLFLEYRLAIPKNLITLSNGGLFSIAVRWYWTLPGTEIYTTWGKRSREQALGRGIRDKPRLPDCKLERHQHLRRHRIQFHLRRIEGKFRRHRSRRTDREGEVEYRRLAAAGAR